MAICNICENKAGLNRFKTMDGWICSKCFKKCGFNLQTPIIRYDTASIKAFLIEKCRINGEFVSTKLIGSFLAFDEDAKKVQILHSIQGKAAAYLIVDYYDILDCDVIEDSISLINGGLGRILAGEDIAEGIEAFEGASTAGRRTKKAFVTDLKVNITINNSTVPIACIQLISSRVDVKSAVYQNACLFADEILGALAVIMNQNIAESKPLPAYSAGLDITEEIRKYKKLMDEGIISSEEFNLKKSQLLGI